MSKKTGMYCYRSLSADCCICNGVNGNKFISLICKHKICCECALNLIRYRTRKCPLCRQRINPVHVKRILATSK